MHWRFYSILLSSFLLLVLTSPIFASQSHTAVFTVGHSTYSVGGNTWTMDAAPFIQDGRTFVPVRYLALAAGVSKNNIRWSASARTVTLVKGDVTIETAVGEKIIYVNNEPCKMDVAPLIRNGRTYLPARYLATHFGCDVNWDGAARAVTITPRLSMPPLDTNQQYAIELAKKDFSQRTGISWSLISTKSAEAVDWPDTSLGCPEPDKMYAQVITPGYRIILTDGSTELEYHADQHGRIVLCNTPS